MTKTIAGFVALAVVALVAGCGDDSTPIDGGADPDSGERDAAPADADTDAAPVDDDEDGVPAGSDCDDADSAVGANAVRECSSACANGFERCSLGVWSACDAPSDCGCEATGATRLVPCGRCGSASQTCGADLTWGPASACFSEGLCAPGEIEHDTELCGDQSRLCDDECAWGDWEVVVPQGECAPGTVTPSAASCAGARTCQADCTYGPDVCGTCSRAPTASRTGADPVCIAAGSFILGTTELPNATPVTTVMLSEFYLDRRPVTAGRYRQCVADGACTASSATGASTLGEGAVAVWLSHDDAADFCEWDGGRLPTEYQWEKAARGAAPDMRTHPLGLAAPDASMCGVTSFCGGMGYALVSSASPLLEFSLAGLTGTTASPWGVEFMGTGFGEMTDTLYQADYRAILTTDPGDPPFPDSATRYTVRAVSSGPLVRDPISGGPTTVSDRHTAFAHVACSRGYNNVLGISDFWLVGFRCAY